MKSGAKMKSASEWYEYLINHPEKWVKFIDSDKIKGGKDVDENKKNE